MNVMPYEGNSQATHCALLRLHPAAGRCWPKTTPQGVQGQDAGPSAAAPASEQDAAQQQRTQQQPAEQQQHEEAAGGHHTTLPFSALREMLRRVAAAAGSQEVYLQQRKQRLSYAKALPGGQLKPAP